MSGSNWCRGAVILPDLPAARFRNTSGNGISDLQGSRAVWAMWGASFDAIWISQFLPSGRCRMGYDISDNARLPVSITFEIFILSSSSHRGAESRRLPGPFHTLPAPTVLEEACARPADNGQAMFLSPDPNPERVESLIKLGVRSSRALPGLDRPRPAP